MQLNLLWNHGCTLGLLVAFVGCTTGDAYYKSTLEVPNGGIASSSLDEFVRIRGSLSPNDDVYFYFRERSLQLSYQMKVLQKRDASESRFCT